MDVRGNIGKLYVLSNGQIKDPINLNSFHPLSTVNTLFVYLEDGGGDGTATMINYKATKTRIPNSHNFPMLYRGLVEHKINGESISRTFAEYVTYIPSIVSRYNVNSNTAMNVEVTVTQDAGFAFIGIFATVELLEAYEIPIENDVAYVTDEVDYGYYQFDGTSWLIMDDSEVKQQIDTKQYNLDYIQIQGGNAPSTPITTLTDEQYKLIWQYMETLAGEDAIFQEDLNALELIVASNSNTINNIIDGTQAFDEISLDDGLGNIETITHASKVALDNEVERLENDKANITYVDSQDDALGVRIDNVETNIDETEADILALETFKDVTVPSTYETIVNVDTKVQGAKDYADDGLSLKENLSNKSINLADVNDIKYPTTKAVKTEIDKKVNKTQTIIGIDLQDNILLNEFKTALGNATSVTSGLMTSQDKTHLDNLVSLLDTNDMNSVVDTIGEILHIFENYPEGANILEVLNDKVDKIEGKGLSENDYTDIDKNKVNLSYTHSEIVDGSNPHNTKFINIADKPTTRDGYGITDVYTKPETYTQQEINALLDNLSAVKGLKSTLLTPTELSNGNTISTNLLTNNGAYVVFTATNTSTEEIDSDTVPVSTITTGKNFVFFDNQGIVFTIGETTSIFQTSEDITLKINLLYLDDENVQAVGVDFDGSLTNYLLNQTNVQEALEKLDNELKTTNDNSSNHITNINNPHSVTKTQVGLGNVDNTSDLNKPISTLTQNALNNKSNVEHTHTKLDITDFEHTHLIEDITDLIEATQALSGLMSATDKQRLDVLHALLEEDTSNSVVDSINEVLAIFNNYPEGADLVSALANKVDKVVGKGLSTNDLTDILKSNYDTAYSWGNHAVEGYLKSITKAMVEAVLTGTITSHNHNGVYEPAFSKNTAFNKNFGTSLNTVAQGNHLHTGVYEPANSNIQSHIGSTSNPHGVSKSQVGLGNVDNTSDGTKYVQGLIETRANVNTKIWTGTQAQYDAIVTKDATTLYFITE